MDGDGKIKNWLVDIGLGQYAEHFIEQNIGFADLPELSDGDLAELGISIGHRKQFRRALNQLHEDNATDPRGPNELLTSSFHDAERRQITVLFADLVGSTRWSTRLDPEDMREVIRAYQAVCTREIREYDGYTARYVGDGILAYFGYPVSHENDPERCVRAALGIIDAMGELNEWVLPMHHARVEVRIGIATGVVVVGDLVGDGTIEQRSVVGETPNLAARLQALANPDCVLVSPSTHKLIGGLFQIQSIGRHQLKGIANEVELWQVLGPEVPESRFMATHSSELSELVGRTSEMRKLKQGWNDATSGDERAVLVSGEPGVGKSRLIQEFRHQLDAESHNCLVVQCWSHTENTALFPVTEMMHRILRITHEDDNQTRLTKLETSLSEIEQSDPGLTQLLAALIGLEVSEKYPPLRLSADAQKRETFIALAKILGTLAALQPTLVVIEDIHWIDPSTREFISFLWPHMAGRRVMLLASIRSGYRDRWPLYEITNVLELQPINSDETRSLVRKIAGQNVLPDALVDSIVDRTDGVPLYIEELTRLVVSDGEGGGAKAETIPSSLQDLLLARLAHLTWEREVAMLCAVLGRRFDYSLIRAVWRGEQSVLDHGLARLVDVGILSHRQFGKSDIYTFRHVLIQEATYSSLLRTDRSALHRSIAEVLENRYTGSEQVQPELLADHFEKSGLFDRAVDYLLVAGQSCSERSANLEAISHLNRALELLGKLPEGSDTLQRELNILVAISSPLVRTRGYAAPEAEQTLVRARYLCSRLGDSPQLIAVLCGLSIFSQARGDLSQARELAEQARSLSESTDDKTLNLLSYRSLGGAAFWQGDLIFARRYLQQGADIYDPKTHSALAYVYFVDPGVVCLSTLALDLWTLGSPGQAMSRALESVNLAETIYHPYSVGFAKLYLATLHQISLETELARDYAREVIELSEAQALPQGISWGSVILGWTRSKLGDPAAGEESMLQGIQLWRKIGTRLILPYFLALLSDAYLESRNCEKGLAAIEEALDLSGDTGEKCWQSELFRLRGEHRLMQRGSNGSAEDSGMDLIEADFRTALSDAQQRHAKSLELRAACSLANFLHTQGRDAETLGLLRGQCGQWEDGLISADLRDAHKLLKSVD
jgi:predicted ATPase/class 3 adenylate cyclase